MIDQTTTLPTGAVVRTEVGAVNPGRIYGQEVSKITDQNIFNLANAVSQLATASALTDPGNAGAIPVTGSGVVSLATAGAETRTLAIPTFAGQSLLMYLNSQESGSDNITVTVAQAIDERGTTTIVFDGTGDAVMLVAIRVASALRWRVAMSHSILRMPQRGPIESLIADPGNAGAIPVTKNGYCPIVTAGSETRTLAIPTFIGQQLLLFIKTDGGTCVITVASAINQTGNTIITMADVNDSIRLHAIDNNGTLCWRVVCNDGAALS